ncbi:Acetyl-CoA carboxylase 1 [Camellia lanceoleosa]|uniref:Acetyl-CoA carboxylase 1 n=1 Tax=Camellia lanceoleosa TaxID=1840588 RepID=A0ACC0F6Q7_9ERIC|nr:Acetyl-CoA carboxylase 1 [Camellia lanceoleosa]
MEHGGGYNAWRRTSVFATPFDFDKAESTRPKGHFVAVRVTSEDPDDGFKPTSGKVQELSFKSKPNVWAYFSVKASDYKDNKIHTGWLDNRIAMRVRAKRPPWYLSVVGGALYIDMVRGGPGSYRLKMNQSEIEAEIHTLRDGDSQFNIAL